MIEIKMAHPKRKPANIVTLSLVNGEMVETPSGDFVRREDHLELIRFYGDYWNYETISKYNFTIRLFDSEAETRLALLDKIKSLKSEIKKLKSELKRNPEPIEKMMKQVLTKLDEVAK